MHAQVETQEFKHKLDIVSRISTKHITLPILQCVLLEVKKTGICIKATNLELGIEATLSGDVREEGIVAVPALTLLQTINLVTQKNTIISLKNNVLYIETKTSKTEIKTVPIEEFPHIPKIDENKQKITGSLLALGIKTTAFAASQSSIKPELGSIYIFQKKGHTLTFVATDSFRLIEKTVPQQGLVFNDPILIPYKNALELARVVDGEDSEANLFVNENQCALQVGDVYITSRLTTGTFPDYEQIIPKEYQSHVTVLRSDFENALKKTNIFLNKFMQLTVVVSTDAITLSAESGEIGTTKEVIHASVDGESITLNFNQRYVTEVLSHLIDDSITLHFAGIGRPMVIEGVHDKTLRYLVMPMNK